MSVRRAPLMMVAVLAFLATLHHLSPAAAFCGFFVSGASEALSNSASQVVLLRTGNHTVMTMSNNYKGPPQDFAMVVPVPVVLKKEQVKTLDAEILRRIDQLSAPRLVEYWEQDPCQQPLQGEGTIGLGSLGTIGHGSGSAGYGSLGVRIEAQFAVGEYQILILSAEESTGLEKWLHQNAYRIPQGAAAALSPYIRDQQKFFVAKVDITKVKRDSHGAVVLSPLRFSFDAAELRLPVRLGLLNASGAQDLLVYILHPSERFELANYANVFIPSNLEVNDAVRKNFPAFYAELFDATLRSSKTPAVVTEYAWQTTSCDPCPVPPLSASDMMTLGMHEGSSDATARVVPEVISSVPQTSGALAAEVARRIVRRNINQLRYCYEKELVNSPALQGRLLVKFGVNAEGAVEHPAVASSTLAPARPGLEKCVLDATSRWAFTKGQSEVTLPLEFRMGTQSFGGGYAGSQPAYVLTRLHARYDRQALSADLIFRAAPPVIGGRASWDGSLGDQGARLEKGGVNNFQGRYIIRHYWEGKIACEKPNYGIWGGPPAGLGGRSGAAAGPGNLGFGRGGATQAATDLAGAPRGQVSLSAVVRSPVPSLGLGGAPSPPLRPGEKPKARAGTPQ